MLHHGVVGLDHVVSAEHIQVERGLSVFISKHRLRSIGLRLGAAYLSEQADVGIKDVRIDFSSVLVKVSFQGPYLINSRLEIPDDEATEGNKGWGDNEFKPVQLQLLRSLVGVMDRAHYALRLLLLLVFFVAPKLFERCLGVSMHHAAP